MNDDITFCLDAKDCSEDCKRNPKNIVCSWRDHSFSHLYGTDYCKKEGKSDE